MTNSIFDYPPNKVLRFGLRVPILLYRMKLGWLLGDRFLLLTHIGRKSGRPHQTVIEVVQHEEHSDTYHVVSGWGERSDWFQNIQKNPSVTIHVGNRQFQAQAMFIPLAKAMEVMEAYAREHPIAFKELSSLFLGQEMKPGREAAKELAERMPMVAFRPVQSDG